jgi:hypothetical protein
MIPSILKKFHGLGDKTEEFIKQRHQYQILQIELISRMPSGFVDQMKTMHKNRFRYSHPSVLVAEDEKVELGV